jgi:DNA polymerase
MSGELSRLLDDFRYVLELEQELFGNTLMLEHKPAHSDAGTMPARTSPVSEEMLLFDLPPVSPPEAAHETPPTTGAWAGATSLDDLNAQICTCTRCPLGLTRTHFVFGVGNPKATLMLIGEAPGADEDAQGEPFVGRAGQLLNRILEAINFRRSDVYICNILKCRPPNNRKPVREEVDQCIPYLRKQIELIRPKIILALGLTAVENLLNTKEPMARLRGRVLQYEGVPVMVTYHPAALLRNPAWKRPAWEDVQALRKMHDELVATH